MNKTWYHLMILVLVCIVGIQEYRIHRFYQKWNQWAKYEDAKRSEALAKLHEAADLLDVCAQRLAREL